MVHLARLAGLDDQSGLHPQALADQLVMDRAGRQRRRDRDALGRRRTVGNDDQIGIREHRLGRLPAQSLQRRLERLATPARGPGRVERNRAERAVETVLDRADLLELGIGQDWLGNLEPLVIACLQAEQVRPRPDHGHETHDQAFADRVDRRVGDLGKVLLEIIVQQPRPVGQYRERGVRAHRTDRIVAVARHRPEEIFEILLGVAENLLAGGEVAGSGLARSLGPRGQVLELILRLPQPLTVRLGVGERRLQLLVLDNPTLGEIDQQHPPWLEPAFADDIRFGDLQHAHLRRHDHAVVVGDDVARRAQPVAVERRADLLAVSKGDRGGAVPRLHQRSMIFVEGAPLWLHFGMAGPRLGDEQHHRMRQRVAARDEQFQRIVEAGGVGLAVRDDRPHLVEIGTKQRRLECAAARVHPVDVAAQRVDFAIVRDQPIGMRQPPRRKSIRREALMDQRQCGYRQRIGEVAEEAAELGGLEHALVDQRAA